MAALRLFRGLFRRCEGLATGRGCFFTCLTCCVCALEMKGSRAVVIIMLMVTRCWRRTRSAHLRVHFSPAMAAFLSQPLLKEKSPMVASFGARGYEVERSLLYSSALPPSFQQFYPSSYYSHLLFPQS